jgi:hypothetical protein
LDSEIYEVVLTRRVRDQLDDALGSVVATQHTGPFMNGVRE